MYTVPSLFDAEDYMSPVDDAKVRACEEHCTFKSEYPCDKDMFELCSVLMEENGLAVPRNPDEAKQLYLTLWGILAPLFA